MSGTVWRDGTLVRANMHGRLRARVDGLGAGDGVEVEVELTTGEARAYALLLMRAVEARP